MGGFLRLGEGAWRCSERARIRQFGVGAAMSSQLPSEGWLPSLALAERGTRGCNELCGNYAYGVATRKDTQRNEFRSHGQIIP